MHFRHPLRVVTTSLDGDVLSFLARADKAFSGREIHRGLPDGIGTQEGVRKALRRLSSQGIVDSEKAGNAVMFRLNREHLAAPWIEALAHLRLQLIGQLRDAISRWEIQPDAAALFGSGARGEAVEDSDLDLFVVRPEVVGADDERWRDQLDRLEHAATRWTGNDTRILEYGSEEIPARPGVEPVIDSVLQEGIELAGSLRRLRLPRRSK